MLRLYSGSSIVLLLAVTCCLSNDDLYINVCSNNVISLKDSEMQTFSGNDNRTDYFKVLETDGDLFEEETLYIIFRSKI